MKGNTFSMSKHIKIADITRAGILIAIALTLNLIFMVYIPIAGFPAVKFTVSSAITMATGIICGPFFGMASGAIVDILTCIIRPVGAYFPGFTIAAMLTGIIPVFLYRHVNLSHKSYTFINILSILLISIGVVSSFIIKGTISINENGNILFADKQIYFYIFVAVFFICIVAYIVVPILLLKNQKDKTLSNKILFCVSITQLITSIILNTWFLSIIAGNAFLFFLPGRIVSNFFIIPIYTAIIISMINISKKLKIME